MRPISPTCQSGLSPRVRGNRGLSLWFMHHWGSIPARTGEPPDLFEDVRQAGVYPRAYGGTSSCWPLK